MKHKARLKVIRGSGGGGDPPSQHVPVELNDTLQSTSFLRFIDAVCEGEIEGLVDGAKSIYLNETRLQNDDGTYNFQGVTFEGRTGTQDQSYLPGFPSVENEIQVSSEFRYGSSSGGDIIRQITNPNVNRVRIRVSIPQLTKTDRTTGDVSGSSVTVALYVQPDGGSYTQVASRTLSGKSSSKYEFTLASALTGNAPWNIKVVRVSADATDSYTQNKTFLESYTEIIDAKLRYPNTALIGMRIDAKQFSSVPSRYYDVKLLKIKVPSNYNPITRVYSGSWDGTFTVAWSDNPAWVFYDLLTNTRYGLGSFIPVDQVDKWALYEIAQYCDELVPDGFGGTEPRFTCNLLLNTRQEAYTVLQNIASVFRGMIYWSAGAVTAVQDSPQDAVKLYQPANAVDGMFAYQGASAKTRHTVALVSWNDPDDFYRLKVEYVPNDEAIARRGIIETEIVAFGCTSRGQAHRLGKWILYTEQYESETVNFKTGLEGIVDRPGDVIKISDPVRAGGRFAGRIAAATTGSVTVDALPSGSLTGFKISASLPDGSIEQRSITGIAGRVVSVSPAFSAAPNAQGAWMMESDAVLAETWRVISVKEEDNGQYSITALKHDPDKFDFVEQDIILEPKSYSILSAAPSAPQNLAASESLYQTPSEVKTKIAFSWDRVQFATGYIVKYKRDNENYVEIPTSSFNEATILDVLPGKYVLQVVAVNSLGKMSPVSLIEKEIYGKTANPADVENFSMIPKSDLALLTWDKTVDLDVSVGGFVRIRHTPRTSDQAWKDAVDIANIAGNATSAVVPLLSGTYMVKFVDSLGNFSENARLIVTTIPDTNALNVVQTVTESPTFPGTKTNMHVNGDEDALTLSASTLFDDEPSVDDMSDFDFPSGVHQDGEYLFSSTVDLGGVWPFRIRSTIDLEAYNSGNQIDSLEQNIDDLADFDGDEINDVTAKIQIRTTNDDPSGSPTWTDWKDISAGEYSARGIQMKLKMTSGDQFHNGYIRTLQVVVDMEDRTFAQGKTASGAGAKAVTYDYPFYALPAIGITAENMATGDYYVISSVSTSGFTITFKNAAGTNIDRDFYVIAKGYGRKIA